MKTRVHCFISGRVQGVSFRSFTQKKAEDLGLSGWVKNLPDGRVELVVEGEEGRIEDFLQSVNKGPPLARVDEVRSKREDYTDEYTDFRIVR